MARWKLMTPHYLNSPGWEWEYKETDRSTMREVRRRVPVPRYIDPKDPSDWNVRWGMRSTASTVGNEEGECIVCFEGKGQPGDIVFSGDPTPDMIPADDEATAISATFTEKWRYKPDTAEVGFSQSLVDKWNTEMADLTSKPSKVEGMDELILAITKMAESNTKVIETFTRRV